MRRGQGSDMQMSVLQPPAFLLLPVCYIEAVFFSGIAVPAA